MRAASFLSEHPVPSHAVGEVGGAILEAMQGEPIDLMVVFFHSAHIGALEDINSALHELLSPRHSIGCSASGVIRNNSEVEFREALSVWVASGLDAQPYRIEPKATAPTTGWQPHWRNAIQLVDPFSSALEDMFDAAAVAAPELMFSGGLASGASGPGGNRFLLDGEIYSDGGVGMALSGVNISTVVSQGCRPIGEPVTVTQTAGRPDQETNIITGLASKRALDVLQTTANSLDEEDKELLSQGLHVGVVIDEQRHDHETGDFLIRDVLGADKETGALAIGTKIEVGTTLQFHVRDAASATDDLIRAVAGHQAQAALVFTCNGRGEQLFEESGHDAEIVHGTTRSTATAGMFCAGEFGPVGKRNHIHGFTASLMLFDL